MNTALRAILVFMVFFGTYVLSWVFFLFVPMGRLDWIGNILALIIAIWVARSVWTRGGLIPGSVFGAVGYGAVVLGSIGFAAGFFGPILFAPEANQGPLLGIFITGPAGALLGALGGFVYGMNRQGRNP